MTTYSGRHAAFLEEIGVGPLWVRRTAAASMGQADEVAAVVAVVAEEQRVAAPAERAPSAWTDASPADASPASGAPAVRSRADEPAMPAPAVAEMDWMQLQAAVAACTKCRLCEQRTHTVFGVGDRKAKWLFIGEGPGRSEDAKGEPFVGPAGKLLDNMLLAIGVKRGVNAYIANIVKCRPTDAMGKDRPPTAAETDACMPYLNRQIALIQPTVIVALGKTAALSLLKRDPDTSVATLRGSVHRYAGLPLIVTYHPAYLLRTPADKRKTWADLCLAMQTYAHAGG
jgi:DNA polymerase